jgi:hypothetical protein
MVEALALVDDRSWPVNMLPDEGPGSPHLPPMVALYVPLFILAVGLTALALVLVGDGIWIAGVVLLAPVAGLGLWMSRQ